MALGPDPKHKFERYIEFDLYILVYKQSHIRTFRNTNFGSQKLKKKFQKFQHESIYIPKYIKF